MKIELNLDNIQNDLSINEYALLAIVYQKKGVKYIKHLGQIDYDDLQRRGYIKFNNKTFDVILREKSLKLFRLNADTFKEFFLLYPERTPKGRPLRTIRTNTTNYTNAARLWNRQFRNKPEEALKALEALNKEIIYRNNTDQMEFMVSVIKWLEDGHYDNEYEVTKSSESSFSDNFGFDDL